MSPRPLAPEFEAALQKKTDAHFAVFFEFAGRVDPAQQVEGPVKLFRIVEGKVLDLDTSTLPDLTGFTADGDFELVGGKIRATPSGTVLTGVNMDGSLTSGPERFSTRCMLQAMLRYDGLADVSGMRVQADVFRPDNAAGFPGAAVLRSMDHGGVAEFFDVGGTGTLRRARTRLIDSGFWANKGGVTSLYNTGVQRYASTRFPGVGGGFDSCYHILGTKGLGGTNVGGVDPDLGSPVQAGLSAAWWQSGGGLCPTLGNAQTGFVEFGPKLRVSRGSLVTVTRLPAGWRAWTTGGHLSFRIRQGNLSGAAGESVVDLGCLGQPVAEVLVKGPGSGGFISLSPPDGVWGGDVYCLGIPGAGPAELAPILNISTAPRNVDLLADGKVWQGVGGVLEHGEIVEADDTRSQGTNIKISAVDRQAVLAALTGTRHRGGTVRIYVGHYSQQTGQLVSPIVEVFRGFTQGGIEVLETHPEDGPGEAVLVVRVASRLAELEREGGIETNDESVQKWYPGETIFRNVPELSEREQPWTPKK